MLLQAFCLRTFNFFFNDSYQALAISLNHCDQTEVSSTKDFSKNPHTFSLSPVSVITQRFTLSAIDLFVCFDFGYFFDNEDFCKIFSTSHIPREIIKLSVDHLFSRGTPGF